MKRIALALFVLLSSVSFGQVTDASLTTQNNNTIYNTVFSPTRHGAMFDAIIGSKVNKRQPSFLDDTDITKVLVFNISAFTSGATRTVSWPNKSGTVAFLDDIGSGGTYTPQGATLATVGGIPSGTNLGVSPIDFQALFDDIFYPYINPVFTSFSVSGQSTTVEVGTTLSGSKTFTWSINANSGVVSTIDLYDITAASTLLAATPNDGSQAQTITTIQLNSNGATQQWRGIGNNSSPTGTFNSSTFTVTGRFYRFFGPTASSPANSADVRALPSSAFDTGGGSFTLNTGTTQTKFLVALPPGRTITGVVDQTALNAVITSEYVLQSSINVLDAGSTNRAYVIYEMNIGVPYSESHAHIITYN